MMGERQYNIKPNNYLDNHIFHNFIAVNPNVLDIIVIYKYYTIASFALYSCSVRNIFDIPAGSATNCIRSGTAADAICAWKQL